MARALPWCIASVAGVGRLPAPGTAGSLVALWPGVLLLNQSPWLLAIAIAGVALAGFWAIPRAGGQDDPGWVVVDEVAGQWLTLLALGHATPLGTLIAFALFRLLDIGKPGPIGWADRRHGAVGVMLDDLFAGAFGAMLILALRAIWPGLLH